MKRVLGENWSLPGLEPLSRPFFTTGKVTLQQCSSCAHIQHPPEEICQACQSFDLGFFQSAGDGRIESVSVVHHAVHPALKDHVPYAVAVVSVDDAPGILVIGNAIGVAPESVRIGDRVSAVFEEAVDPGSGEQMLIPQWRVSR